MMRKTGLFLLVPVTVLLTLPRAGVSCNTIELPQSKSFQNLPYLGEQYRRRIKKFSALNFVPVYRETIDSKKHWKVLETNPHFKAGVTVCAGHKVTVYVGVYPYFPLPNYSDELASTMGSAVQNTMHVPESLPLDPIPLRFVCKNGEKAKEAQGKRVIGQFPEAGKLMHSYFEGNRPKELVAPTNEVLLYLDCEPQPCPSNQCPPQPSPEQPPPAQVTQYSVVHLSSAAAGGATLAYFLSIGAQRQPKQGQKPRIAKVLSASRVRVRAVPDFP
jgi:hypothetical protein